MRILPGPQGTAPGHPYAIKYPAVTTFHSNHTTDGLSTNSQTADGQTTCHITNLCETHSPRHDQNVRTAEPGQPCSKGPSCSIQRADQI